jgi:hypothetical protein
MNRFINTHRFNAVKVRLSDSAVLAGVVSLLYALAVMVSPRAFPELLQRVFVWERFFPTLIVLLVATNEILFVLICRRRAQKPGLITPVYIAFLTIAVVSFFRLLVYGAHAQALLSQLVLHSSRVRQGISSEELLIYTHLAIVSGIFLPYLLVRVTQNYVADEKPANQDVKVQNAVAGK